MQILEDDVAVLCDDEGCEAIRLMRVAVNASFASDPHMSIIVADTVKTI